MQGGLTAIPAQLECYNVLFAIRQTPSTAGVMPWARAVPTRHCCPRARAAGAGEVHRLVHALAAAGRRSADRDRASGMPDADTAAGDHDLHGLADQPPGHGVAVGVELDRAMLIHRTRRWSPLKAWGMRLSKRVGACGSRAADPDEPSKRSFPYSRLLFETGSNPARQPGKSRHSET